LLLNFAHVLALNGALNGFIRQNLYKCVLKCNDALIDYLKRIDENIQDPDTFSYSGRASYLGFIPTYATLLNCDNFVSGLVTMSPTSSPMIIPTLAPLSNTSTLYPTFAPFPQFPSPAPTTGSPIGPQVGTCKVKCTAFPIAKDIIGRYQCRLTEGNTRFFGELVKAADQSSRRRSLEVVDTKNLMVEHGNNCSDLDYDMYLVMEGVHMAGLAIPVDEEKRNCPNMIFHSELSGERKLTKVALKAKAETVKDVSDDDKFYVGRRSLDVIVEAFHSADVNVGEWSTGMYDVVSNNCAGLLRNMAYRLDIPVDQKLIGFVTKQLLSQKGDKMIELMSRSSGMSSLWNYGTRNLEEDVTPEKLVEKVIGLYV
jgi:hypothetical protein